MSGSAASRCDYGGRAAIHSSAKTARHARHGKPHFIIFTQGFKPPKAETYCGTEAPKGELGFFIVSDGSARPYRLKIRAPSFVHMGAFDHMARGYLISDIITIFGTYDIVMGECDR
jgi:NADH-quinone oxidoreductase subunit C/D